MARSRSNGTEGLVSMTDLDGKVVLVTGAQEGIGRAMATAFAESGTDVAINYLDNLEAAERVAAAVRGHGRRAIVIQGDVASLAAASAMGATTVERLGRIGILINNAGGFPRGALLGVKKRDWDYVIDVNFNGTCLCLHV